MQLVVFKRFYILVSTTSKHFSFCWNKGWCHQSSANYWNT